MEWKLQGMENEGKPIWKMQGMEFAGKGKSEEHRLENEGKENERKPVLENAGNGNYREWKMRGMDYKLSYKSELFNCNKTKYINEITYTTKSAPYIRPNSCWLIISVLDHEAG